MLVQPGIQWENMLIVSEPSSISIVCIVLTRLHESAESTELSLVAYAISIKLLCTGFDFLTVRD